MNPKSKKEFRNRRHLRLRRKISGTAERPRMSVTITNQHIYVQFIDDLESKTIASASTLMEGLTAIKNVDGARQLGIRAAEIAKSKGIAQVTFDRGGRKFHGRLKAIADAVKEAGLVI